MKEFQTNRILMELTLTSNSFNSELRFRGSRPEMFLKISQNPQGKTCVRVSFLRDSGVMFSCEFCEIFKNTYFLEHLRTAASEDCSYGYFLLNIRQEFFLVNYL